MKLNDAGLMIKNVWDEIRGNYRPVETDQFIIMPNHIHGIIMLPAGATPRGCPFSTGEDSGQARGPAPTIPAQHRGNGHPQGDAPTMSLPDVVHRFKSYTTARYRFGVALMNWPPFHGKLWQRNYYDRIIRNEKELTAIREYIRHNPAQWASDNNNPEKQ